MRHPRRPRPGAWRPAVPALLLLLLAVTVAASEPVSLPAPAFVPAGSYPGAFHELEAATLFYALDAELRGELWVTDGSRDGTVSLDVCRGACGAAGFAVGGSSELAFYWLPNAQSGYDLWRSDGTVPGTARLTHLGATTFGSNEHEPQFLWLAESGRLLFWLHDNARNRATLWTSDGSESGTRPLLVLPQGSGAAGRLTRAGDGAVFVTATETAPGALHLELWSTDGTAGGTALVTSLPASGFSEMVQSGAGALFTILPPGGASSFPCKVELWSSHGTAATTARLGEFDVYLPYCNGASLAVQGDVGKLAYFLVGAPGSWVIWRTDGTPAGTAPHVDLAGRPGSVVSGVLAEWRGHVYFAGNDPQHGTELWRSNGTPAGTVRVADVCPGPCSSFPNLMQAAGEYLFFYSGAFFDNRPWMTDGTGAGTRPRSGFCSDCRSGWFAEVRAGSSTFFPAYDPQHGYQLWASSVADGSLRRLTTLEPFQAVTQPLTAGRRGDLLLFSADDGIHGFEPWVSDGTVAGTGLLRDLTGADDSPDGPPGRPPTPHLTVHGPDVVELFWDDVPGATRYRLAVRQPSGSAESVIEGLGSNQAFFSLLQPGTPVTVRLRAENPFGASEWSEEVSATTLSAEPTAACVPAPDVLCLWSDRFRVEVDWRDQRSGDHGTGKTLPALDTDRSGHFWFFKADNLELIVKVLDGSGVNGFWWTFYGALTDVEYWITVSDGETGARRTYHNAPGTVCGRGDTSSLSIVGGSAAAVPQAAPPPGRLPAVAAAPEVATAASHPVEPCAADSETLCLLDGRFRVRVEWRNQHNGTTGTGRAVFFTERTGLFTFFNPNNVELVVKALDGQAVNGHYWLFYGALSDVGYTITVEDLVDGHTRREYVNPPGEICGRADTTAF